jgi:hypothetical protein
MMGWWKCNCNGGIDATPPSGHEGGSLINAIPGRDTIEDYYNGDTVADTMYVPIAIVKNWFINREPKPTREQLVKLFTEKEIDPVFKHVEKSKIENLIDKTWKEIDAIYNEQWSRPAYPEERVLICKFSFGGANGKGRKDWWHIREIDKGYIKNFNEGKWPYWWRTGDS